MPEEESQFLKPGMEQKEIPKREEVPESLELQREGDRIYSEEFAGKLNEILAHGFKIKGKDGQEQNIVLKDIVDKHLEVFSSSEFPGFSTEEKAEKQRGFVKDLGRGINGIPADDPWSFYFQRIMETGKINCSGSTSLLGMVLENTKEKSGIKSVEHGFPFGHAVNMITFGDGRLYFADARSGALEDVSDYTKTEEKDGLKVYKINQPEEKTDHAIPWRDVPVTGVKEGAVNSYLENMGSVYDAAMGHFDKALKMGRSKEELGQIQEEAKKICQENNSSLSKNFNRWMAVKRFFNEKIHMERIMG